MQSTSFLTGSSESNTTEDTLLQRKLMRMMSSEASYSKAPFPDTSGGSVLVSSDVQSCYVAAGGLIRQCLPGVGSAQCGHYRPISWTCERVSH